MAKEPVTRRELLVGINAGLIALGAARLTSAETAPVPEGPRRIREIEHVWIPMSDGTRLAARIWIPEDAEQNPVPALLEYIPYRKRDVTRLWDEPQHSYFASHGYACLRVDIRGSGDSEGAVGDEYIRQEQDDGVEIIAWIASQSWCTGAVGMFGLSWGGFSSLQVAARRPPALKAIIMHCAGEDRFTNDMHYSGGCINEGMFVWSSVHTTNGLMPPDPEFVGPQWREVWRKRLEGLEFFAGDWLSHHRRDEFWKHGSISEDYSQIQCAVYAVGGWTDPYHASVPRLLANLKSPRKGLMGPWNHHFPYAAWPGPQIDWLNEALRWWDHWLKGANTGIMQEPMYRAWMPEEPTTFDMTEVKGRWVAEEVWPSPRIRMTSRYLSKSGLRGRPDSSEGMLRLTSTQTVGVTAPYWFCKTPSDLPADQRIDDARSLVFDSEPLEQPMEMLGAAVAHIELSVDKPVAYLIARLCEVTVDGESHRITYGVLNLCHRESHDHPTALVPGKRHRVRLAFGDIAHAFKVGSRLRVALSTTYWPMIWPSPEPVTLTVYTANSRLDLPTREPQPSDASLRAFGKASGGKDSGSTQLVPRTRKPTLFEWNQEARTLTTRIDFPYSRRRLNATGTEIAESWTSEATIQENDPLSARIEQHRSQWFYRPGWDVQVESVLRFSGTKEAFLAECEVKCLEAGKLFFSRKWRRPIPRDLI